MSEYIKEFDLWNSLKQKLHVRVGVAYAHPREVWWCSLGVNIGAEIDGKNESFERPVLVIRVYNKETLLVVPITTKPKDDIFHFKIISESKETWVSLTQLRVISNKRLLRKVDVVSIEAFRGMKEVLRNFT